MRRLYFVLTLLACYVPAAVLAGALRATPSPASTSQGRLYTGGGDINHAGRSSATSTIPRERLTATS